MKLRYKKLGPLLYDCVQFKGTKCLQITTHKVRVCCFSSIGAQNCQLIHVAENRSELLAEVFNFLEVGCRGVQYFLSVHATEVCIFLEVEHCVVVSHVRCKINATFK